MCPVNLFSHYKVGPEPLHARARVLRTQAQRYGDQVAQLRARHGIAVNSTAGVLFPEVCYAADKPADSATELGRQALVYSGATTLWAVAIEQFNSAVDSLNHEYEAAVGTHFGTPRPTEADSPDAWRQFHGDVSAAKAALIARLDQRHQALKERLHDTALGVSNLYRTDPKDYEDLVTGLMASGLLPSSLTGGGSAITLLPPRMASIADCIKGNDFEAAVLRDLGLSKNTTIFDVVADGVVTRRPFTARGNLLKFMFPRGTIPDGYTAKAILEIKFITGPLKSSKQLLQQAAIAVHEGKVFHIVLGPNSTGLDQALIERLDGIKGLRYKVSRVERVTDTGELIWEGAKPQVGRSVKPGGDDTPIDPPFCGPPGGGNTPTGPDPIPVPEPVPVVAKEPEGRPLWQDLLIGAGVTVAVSGIAAVSVAGTPFTGGASDVAGVAAIGGLLSATAIATN